VEQAGKPVLSKKKQAFVPFLSMMQPWNRQESLFYPCCNCGTGIPPFLYKKKKALLPVPQIPIIIAVTDYWFFVI
jgi:hypothetical protein